MTWAPHPWICQCHSWIFLHETDTRLRRTLARIRGKPFYPWLGYHYPWMRIIHEWRATNAEAKAGLQPPSGTREIDSRCPKGQRPAKTNDSSSAKDPQDSEAKQKNKSSRIFSTHSANGSGSQSGKKDQSPHPSLRCQEFSWDKWSAQDPSYIICFHFDQKGHYATQCSKPGEGFDASGSPVSDSSSSDLRWRFQYNLRYMHLNTQGCRKVKRKSHQWISWIVYLI